jgi:hypothetical protein
MNNATPQPAPGTNGAPAQQPAQEDFELTLTLKVSQINTIIAALDELPHKYSRPIIDTISQQAVPQVQQQQQASVPEGPLAEKTIQ